MPESTDPPALPAELTICTAAEVQAQLCRWLAAPAADGADPQVLVVDGSAVAEVDACGVQLLLSLARSLAQQRRRLALQPASSALATACGVLGVQQTLGLAEPAGATA